MNSRIVKCVSLTTCLSAGTLAIALLSAGCASTPYKESTGEYIDDSTITAKVKSKYATDPDVSAMQVKVETYKGVVQLSGFVNDKTASQKAEELAKNIRGVVRVENNIIVKPIDDNGSHAEASEYKGTITAIDADRHTLTVKSMLISHTFELASGARIVGATKPNAGFDDLHVGDEVKVSYAEQNGVKIASRVEQIEQKASR